MVFLRQRSNQEQCFNAETREQLEESRHLQEDRGQRNRQHPTELLLGEEDQIVKLT